MILHRDRFLDTSAKPHPWRATLAAAGALTVNGEPAGARDGVTLSDVEEIVIAATEDSEILLADVA